MIISQHTMKKMRKINDSSLMTYFIHLVTALVTVCEILRAEYEYVAYLVQNHNQLFQSSNYTNIFMVPDSSHKRDDGEEKLVAIDNSPSPSRSSVSSAQLVGFVGG